ncbi:MAG: DUF1566 domain-containing protein [Desulfobulbaceae bacterium]|nr:DUF1566 domain-containing protein [Desulfobulbaceae bacterium]
MDSSGDETNKVFQYEGDGICLDIRTGRMWQVERGGSFSSLQEAEQYAANMKIGGHNDWRLPTRAELYDLHDIFFWEKNGNCTMNTTGDFWTASEKGEKPLGHWETYYLCGPEFKYSESLGSDGYVRAVRP